MYRRFRQEHFTETTYSYLTYMILVLLRFRITTGSQINIRIKSQATLTYATLQGSTMIRCLQKVACTQASLTLLDLLNV